MEKTFHFDVTRSRPHSHNRHHHCQNCMYPQPYIHSYNSHHFHYNKIHRYRHVLENHRNRWALKDLRMYHRIHRHHSQSIGSGWGNNWEKNILLEKNMKISFGDAEGLLIYYVTSIILWQFKYSNILERGSREPKNHFWVT